MNKAITEYRKASAEALKIPFRYPPGMTSQHYRGIPRDYYYKESKWQPNKDAEQMLMVWEWLKEQKKGDIYRARASKALYEMVNKWLDDSGSDIKLTTMKVFMEYIKTK